MLFQHNPVRRVMTIIFALVLFAFLTTASRYVHANADVKPLVNTQWLADNLNNKGLRLIHVASMGGKKEHFDMKHIPGSVYLGISELMGVMGNGSAPPVKAKFEDLMSNFGVKNDTHVIILGVDGGNPFTTGAFWLMKYFGHDKVSYLDGGIKKWIQEKRVTTGKPAIVNNTKYSARPDDSIFATASYVLQNIGNPDTVILDVRSVDEYTGKANPVENKRTGHIPGAINMNFYPTNLNSDGTFKSGKELKAEYEAKGVTKDKEVIIYCQGGIRAAHTHFVLQYLLDYPRVRNYVGSWGEWGNRLDPAKYPVEK